MTSENLDLRQCKQLIEQKLNWGTSDSWTSADFEQLQQRVLDETGISLSASTLRRIWGRVDYGHVPSHTTLNTLARFAGHTDWREFVRAQSCRSLPINQAESEAEPSLAKGVDWWWFGWGMGVLVVVGLITFVAVDRTPTPSSVGLYRFASKPLTRTLPNSVIFTYDASAAPTDSVYIQQSWNPRRREVVSRAGHTHTSIYYEPGFYQAKLVVGDRVVKQHPLLIPTDGWLGTISTRQVPIYLKPTEYVEPGQLRLPSSTIQQLNVSLQPQPPLVRFSNVGNFEPVSVQNFSFSNDVKSEYGEGAAACQLSWIVLITTDMPIVIPLGAKGCVSELSLLDGTRMVSGKHTDLSSFGVDFTNWVHVNCKSNGKKLVISINEKVAYTSMLPAQPVNIVGLSYWFRGTGAVKNVRLQEKDKLVFGAF
ncbi:hypothetical protein [Spirosoma radiotolerans]|uniref:hypothetical protein n=1 Tax=Spirosoma radiotolerans TaxID=1379870 RepID=UPI00061D0D4E|nr:hypothetical protein [Spirosoma radiotolerans]